VKEIKILQARIEELKRMWQEVFCVDQ
jgi:hypothetical protein